ncbi:MAG: flagellar motor switch protein FliM [bacterium]
MSAVATTRQIRSYDFRRPDRLSKEQLERLSGAFSTFGRLLSPSMGLLMRTPVRTTVEGADQQLYEEFIRGVPPTACVGLFHATQLGGRMVVLMNLADAALITDLMLGGRGEVAESGRPLGETDRLVLERFFALWPDHLRTTWQPITRLDIVLETVHGSTEFIQLASGKETVIVLHLSIAGLPRPVTADVLLLHVGLQPLLSRLSASAFPSPGMPGTTKAREIVRRAVLEVPVEARVRIDGMPIGIRELATVSPGDVISLGAPIARPLGMWVGDQEIAACRLGAVGTRMAVQVIATQVDEAGQAPQGGGVQ